MWLRDYHKHDDDLVPTRPRPIDILAVALGSASKTRGRSQRQNRPAWSQAAPGATASASIRRSGCSCVGLQRCRRCYRHDPARARRHFLEACRFLTGESQWASPVLPPKPRDDHESDHARRMREGGVRIWAATAAIEATGKAYFDSRAIFGPLPTSLRFLAELEHWPTRQMLPAIVARVDGVDGSYLGVHLTFLTSDGKANTALGDKRKLMLGGTRGGAVRLGEPAGGELAVAEGIETALSVMDATGRPTWRRCPRPASRRSSSRLASLPSQWQPTATSPASKPRTRRRYARRTEGRRVLIRPAPWGMDYNDIAQARARRVAIDG